ncbi:MAG: DUF1992 domain-containing protein [Anaerolineales bacterium]|nr:DUF1992 domain-containing protein [Anaerolineales bacterium]
MDTTNPDPRERARDYKTQEEPPDAPAESTTDSKSRLHRTPEQWQDLVSQRIEEAMRAGEFDNLAGKGKPLNPDPDPFTPADMKMANSLLRNNELVPAWISDRKAVLEAIERFRVKLQTTAAAYQTALESVTVPQHREELVKRYNAQVESWRQEIIELNKRIQTQNLRQPVTFLEIYKLRLDDELASIGAPVNRQ